MFLGAHVQNWISIVVQEGISALIGQVWGTLCRPIWATVWEWGSGGPQGKSRGLWPGKMCDSRQEKGNFSCIFLPHSRSWLLKDLQDPLSLSCLNSYANDPQMHPVLVWLLSKELWTQYWSPSMTFASVNSTRTASFLKNNTEHQVKDFHVTHRSDGGPFRIGWMGCSRWLLRQQRGGEWGQGET